MTLISATDVSAGDRLVDADSTKLDVLDVALSESEDEIEITYSYVDSNSIEKIKLDHMSYVEKLEESE